MRRKVTALFLIAFLVLSCSVTVFAQTLDYGRTGSITMTLIDQNSKQPIVGAEFDVHFIATAGINTDNNLNYIYTRSFENCGIPLDDLELPLKLSAYLAENTADAIKIVTDEKGEAVCSNLQLGLYLVKQAGAAEGFSLCTPFLVTVPIQTETGFVYDVEVAPKTDIIKLVSISIKKNWNTDKTTKIPASVTVQLLRDGEVVETATLNKENSWQITYTNMPESDAYSIREVDVPKGFTATYAHEKFDFTVTNTAALAQTGQRIWPIPVLAAAGLFFLCAGFVLLRKPEGTNA